jgi:hypothetical protein
MSNQTKGTVKAIFDTQTFSSGFQKREFVITTEEQYPQDIKFEVVKEKCGDLDRYAVGQQLTVYYNLRGNEHLGKYYVSLQAWKLEGAKLSPDPVAAIPVAEDSSEPF